MSKATPFLPVPMRRYDLIIEVVNGETLIYDESCHRAFCLNAIATEVWHRCNGSTTPSEIADSIKLVTNTFVNTAVVELALADFRHDCLLQPQTLLSPPPTMSRRAMVIKLGMGAAMAPPVITSIVAPKAAQAYNGDVNS
jgi:hypothetical protein